MMKFINSDMYKFILDELDIFPPLDYEEELSLFKKVSMGDKEAREKLAKHNMRLVFSTVSKLPFVDSNNFEDIFQSGMSALLEAIDNFDLSHDVKFSTYAVRTIIINTRRDYYNTGKMIRYPINIEQNKRNVVKKINDMLDNKCSISDISKELNMSEEDVIMYIHIDDVPTSLFEVIRDTDDLKRIDYFASKEEGPEEISITNNINKELVSIINNTKLTEKEKKVIFSLYLNNTKENITPTSMAKEFGCTRQYIKNLERSAFKKIRLNDQIKKLAGVYSTEKSDLDSLKIMRDFYKNHKRSAINGVIGVHDGNIVSLSKKINK